MFSYILTLINIPEKYKNLLFCAMPGQKVSALFRLIGHQIKIARTSETLIKYPKDTIY